MNIQELEDYKYEPVVKPSPPVPYFDNWISPYHHPSSIASDMLREVKHFEFSGISLVGPMGSGKSTMATCIAHHIHNKNPEYNILWKKDDDFSHIKRCVAEIPKQPSIIIFDDVTSSLKELGGREMQMNFKELTKIRHTFNEGGMEGIPIIMMVIFHYSLNLEKSTRSVIRNNCYMGFGNVERTNIDLIAPKDSQARMEISKFARIYRDMCSPSETFYLKTNNAKKSFVLDQPFRPALIVRETQAKIILFSKDDKCNICSFKPSTQFLPADEIFTRIKSAYGRFGIQALKLQLWKRGYYKAITTRAASASQYIENSIFAKYTTDMDGLVQEIYKDSHTRQPQRLYRHKQIEAQLNEDLHKASYTKEEPGGFETPDDVTGLLE